MKNKNSSGPSLILFVPKQIRSFLAKFFVIALFLISLLTIFVVTIDSPFSRTVRVWALDSYGAVAEVFSVPVEFFSNIGFNVSNYFFVHSKNEILQQENEKLKRALTSLSGIKSENARLMELLNFVKEKPNRLLSVRLVGFAGGSYLDLVTINAGSADGVESGQALVSSKGFVGRITEVGNNSSRALLISDVSSRIPVITSVTRKQAIMAGGTKKYPELLYLDKNNQINEGEEVLTSGDGELLPPGLPIGLVFKTEEGYFAVKPYTNFQNLEHLTILIRQQQQVNSQEQVIE